MYLLQSDALHTHGEMHLPANLFFCHYFKNKTKSFTLIGKDAISLALKNVGLQHYTNVESIVKPSTVSLYIYRL